MQITEDLFDSQQDDDYNLNPLKMSKSHSQKAIEKNAGTGSDLNVNTASYVLA